MHTSHRLALVGALLGAFASAYLLVDYVFGSGICLTGSGCDVVRSSAFAYPLGIPMPLLGLGFYLAAIVALLVAPSRRVAGARVDLLAAGWSVAGVVVMAFLTFVELVVIGAICSWCLLSAVASTLLAGGAIAAWRRERTTPIREAHSARARRRLGSELERSRRELHRFTAVSASLFGVTLIALLVFPALTNGAPADEASVGDATAPRLGSGPVEVVVFSDFQCPACATVAPALSRLADEGAITLIYRYFPLVSIHANASAAAEAAHAAGLQDHFWEFHDVLFASQAAWAHLPASEASAAFEAIAAEIGLDVPRWQADLASESARNAVAGDAREAARLRLSGTPTIFVGGERYGGPISYDALRSAVDGAERKR